MLKSVLYYFLGALLIYESAQAQTISLQDSTGLPGDNFSLEGALEMFKQAGSPEEFEKLLNAEDSKVNNLDLNGDGSIDYIRVLDKKDGEAHAIILQAIISETEYQDIAVIELEQTGDDVAVLQIVGDEDIYGEPLIVEPTGEMQSKSSDQVVVNVWNWPSVRYVYAPSYVLWVSPWSWRARPVWWHPWRPVRRHVFYGYRAPYHRHYIVVTHHRVAHARRIYAPVRTTSVIVHNRNQQSVSRYRATHTTVRTVEGRNGRVRKTKTTTRVRPRRQ